MTKLPPAGRWRYYQYRSSCPRRWRHLNHLEQFLLECLSSSLVTRPGKGVDFLWQVKRSFMGRNGQNRTCVFVVVVFYYYFFCPCASFHTWSGFKQSPWDLWWWLIHNCTGDQTRGKESVKQWGGNEILWVMVTRTAWEDLENSQYLQIPPSLLLFGPTSVRRAEGATPTSVCCPGCCVMNLMHKWRMQANQQNTQAWAGLHKSTLIDSIQSSKIYFCKKMAIINFTSFSVNSSVHQTPVH